MNEALQLCNRWVMMHMGKVIFDIHAKEKRHLSKTDLHQQFYAVQGEEISADRMPLP